MFVDRQISAGSTGHGLGTLQNSRQLRAARKPGQRAPQFGILIIAMVHEAYGHVGHMHDRKQCQACGNREGAGRASEVSLNPAKAKLAAATGKR